MSSARGPRRAVDEADAERPRVDHRTQFGIVGREKEHVTFADGVADESAPVAVDRIHDGRFEESRQLGAQINRNQRCRRWILQVDRRDDVDRNVTGLEARRGAVQRLRRRVTRDEDREAAVRGFAVDPNALDERHQNPRDLGDRLETAFYQTGQQIGAVEPR